MTAALVASTYGHVSDDVQRDTANTIGRRNIVGAAERKMSVSRMSRSRP